MDKEFEKVQRHLPLALSIDILLIVLIVAPIWVIAHTPDNTYEPIFSALQWWPWMAAVEVGLVIYYIICDDRVLVELAADTPRVILYAVILLATAWWWFPQVRKYEEEQ